MTAITVIVCRYFLCFLLKKTLPENLRHLIISDTALIDEKGRVGPKSQVSKQVDFNESGLISKITYVDMPGEQESLLSFYKLVGLMDK